MANVSFFRPKWKSVHRAPSQFTIIEQSLRILSSFVVASSLELHSLVPFPHSFNHSRARATNHLHSVLVSICANVGSSSF